MEDVLAVYALPYDPLYPVVCMDESSRQLIGEVAEPIPAAPGRPARVDHEYVRNGVAQIFLEVEPLAGRRHLQVTDRRTARDWALWIKSMLDERYPKATKVRLVLDNLNTHTPAVPLSGLRAQEARRLAERIEFHFTPKHGSWLNVAEIELSALQQQCLDRRIPDKHTMQSEIAAWQDDRNHRPSTIDWQFQTSDARIKLRHLYPKL